MAIEGELGRESFSFDEIIGYNDLKEEAKKNAKIAEFILIQGGSGVGKKLFPQAIHNFKF